MDILRNPFRSLASGIVRLLILAAVLLAAYLLLVRPALHSGEHTVNGVEAQIRAKLMHVLHDAEKAGSPHRVAHCVDEANGNVHRLQRCIAKF